MKLVFLGTGTSHGVPMIGCQCAVCTSADPMDRRMRPSVAFQYDGRTVLVDTTPELRLQCLANRISRVDAVVYTHHHADHVMGIDDLRRFNALQGVEVPLYATARTCEHLERMFTYAFEDDPDYPSAKPQLTLRKVDGPFDLFGRRVVPIPMLHGELPVIGVRIGPIAYCTDVNVIPEASMGLLDDLDVLVLDGLRKRPHATHFNLAQAVEVAKGIGAKRTLFTHIAHELPHAETNRALPEGMALAYDRQVVDVEAVG